MNENLERRTSGRQRCSCDVDWAYFNKEDTLKGRALNFSQEGSYIESTKPINIGATVLIRVLQCTDCVLERTKDLRFNFIAEVKWCCKMKETKCPRYGIGLRYYCPD